MGRVGTVRRAVRDFGAAEDDLYFRRFVPEEGEQFGHVHGVPDVDAEAEDLRVAGGDGVGDFGGGLLDREFGEICLWAQLAHVGQ